MADATPDAGRHRLLRIDIGEHRWTQMSRRRLPGAPGRKRAAATLSCTLIYMVLSYPSTQAKLFLHQQRKLARKCNTPPARSHDTHTSPRRDAIMPIVTCIPHGRRDGRAPRLPPIPPTGRGQPQPRAMGYPPQGNTLATSLPAPHAATRITTGHTLRASRLGA